MTDDVQVSNTFTEIENHISFQAVILQEKVAQEHQRSEQNILSVVRVREVSALERYFAAENGSG